MSLFSVWTQEKKSLKQAQFSLCFWVNRDFSAVLAKSFVTNYTVCGCKQSVVSAAAYICTGVDLGSALTVNNRASMAFLAVSQFCS